MKHTNLLSAMSTIAAFLGGEFQIYLQEHRLVARISHWHE